jgi:3-phenylpropionate/trans-cinnamate dioxygenase ferredoxin subunit
MAFVEVAEVSEIPAGTMKSYLVGIWQVLVANVDGKFYAMKNTCTHEEQSLSQGTLTGKIVTCPLHGAKFDVTTGKNVAGPKTGLFGRAKTGDEQVYEVKVDGGKILINS